MTRGGAASILPVLAPDEARHSAAVRAAVRARIEQQGGWIAFDDYLRIVLYAPGLGYYSAGSVKFGRDGDFLTAPELSALFGQCLARQCAQVLQSIGGGNVLELGAGSGALAAVLLPALAALGSLPEHYDIVEISADLAQRQRARLGTLPAALSSRIRWRERLPEAPITGVLLANEVADALPFRRFVIGSEGLLERGVASPHHDELRLSDRAADEAFKSELQRLQLEDCPHGYESELCPLLGAWIATLGASLAQGVVLIVDYGLSRHEYYHPQRSSGTLRCHFRHRAHADALLYPGLQDITAWVDFTRIAEAGSDAGLTLAGYCTQAAFLLANGIEADVGAASGERERVQLASEARTLLLPAEMGESCKVIALTRALDAPLRGFAYQDLRRML